MYASRSITQPFITPPKKSFSKWVLENTSAQIPVKRKTEKEQTPADKEIKKDSADLNMGIGAKEYAPKPPLKTTSVSAYANRNNTDETAENKKSTYDSFSVRIIGDDTTEKDYEDFLYGFSREDNTFSDDQKPPASRAKYSFGKYTSNFPKLSDEQDRAFYEGFFDDDLGYDYEPKRKTVWSSTVGTESATNGKGKLKKSLFGYSSGTPDKSKATSKDDLSHIYFDEKEENNISQKRYLPADFGNKRKYGNVSLAEGLDMLKKDGVLDDISSGLSVLSFVPGLDTAADLMAIPVDLMKGDYISALFDLAGALPWVGEAADAAKSARKGVKAVDAIADTGKVADDAIGIVGKTLEKADEISDTHDIYKLNRVDDTIAPYLDSVDDPISELSKMSGDIAKTSPIAIPENAKIKPQIKKGYYHMEYKWTDMDGYDYEVRWHTRNPTAPIDQRDTWIVKRGVKGIGYGSNSSTGFSEVMVAHNMWVDWKIWEDAVKARKNGKLTKKLEEILKNGHWKA